MQNDIGEYISVAKVLEVYPDKYTAMVETKNSSDNEFGKFVECKISALKLSTLGAASVTLPMPQDMVYISTQQSQVQPHIIGYYVPTTTTPSDSAHQHRVTPLKKVGAFDKTLDGGSNYTRGISPGDVMPGDSITVGEDGQMYGILTGGTFIAKASALCQLILTKTKGTALLVARRLKIYTDFGEILSTSENGLASLQIKGNSSVQQTNKATRGHAINIQLGGKSLFNAKLGSSYHSAINNAGQLTMLANGLYQEIQNRYDLKVSGSSNWLLRGPSITTYTKGHTMDLKGLYRAKIDGKSQVTITGSSSITVAGEARMNYQGVKDEKVSGIGTDSLDNAAYRMTTGVGDVEFNVGKVGLGGLPAPIIAPFLGSFRVKMLAGNFDVNTNFGDIELNTWIGTATLRGTLKATLESKVLTSVKGSIVQLDAQIRQLDGASSIDPVVTSLKLVKTLFQEMIMIFNIHQHPPIPPILGGPVLPPLMQMKPILPTDVSNKTTLS